MSRSDSENRADAIPEPSHAIGEEVWVMGRPGQFRVVAIVDGYAMLRRDREQPIVAPTDRLLTPADAGWDAS